MTRDQILRRLVTLQLDLVTSHKVMDLIDDVLEDFKRSGRGRTAKWRAKKVAASDQAGPVLIKFDTPQWRAWEKYRGKKLPVTQSSTWRVPTEWPPGWPPAETEH